MCSCRAVHHILSCLFQGMSVNHCLLSMSFWAFMADSILLLPALIGAPFDVCQVPFVFVFPSTEPHFRCKTPSLGEILAAFLSGPFFLSKVGCCRFTSARVVSTKLLSLDWDLLGY